jgi:RpiB/LacA/LacB family sugar-phosphate isomerase
MRIAVGSDHRGFRYKTLIKQMLEEAGHSVKDFGAHSEAPQDYPDIALAVAKSVSCGESERGVLICSSGVGMSMAANRVKGVRAALCMNEKMAQLSRMHNDSNVLCLGQDLIDEGTMRRIVQAWLTTGFEGGRHSRRIAKLDG